MADQSLIATLTLGKLADVSTPSSTPSSMSVANITDFRPGKVCRFLDLGQAEVTFDLTAALSQVAYHGISSYRYVLVIGSTITSAGTVEAWTGASESAVASTGTATLHVGPLPYWHTIDNDRSRFPVRHTVVDLGSQRTDAFLRVKLSDPLNPDGFLDVGVVFPSPGYVPALPIKTKPSMGATEDLRQTISVSGAKHIQKRPIYRQREITIQAVGPTARAEVEANLVALQETVGVDEPFAAITDLAPTARYMNGFVYGTLTALKPVLIPEAWGASELTFAYEELK
jgi:hypothetical protein